MIYLFVFGGFALFLLLGLFQKRYVPGYRFFAGMHGEKAVARELYGLGKDYVVLNDILLKLGSSTCQIDHVVISVYGIFVVETKNFKGKVTGSDQWRQWRWDGGSGSKAVYSPVEQNARHTEVLAKSLHVSKDLLIPVVVFAGSAHIRVDTRHAVLFLSQLVPFIRLFRHQQLSPGQRDDLADMLRKRNVTDGRVRESHRAFARRASSS